MCHSCVSSNPGLFPRKREPRSIDFFFLDSRFRGNDTLGLDGRGRGEQTDLTSRSLHVAKMLPGG